MYSIILLNIEQVDGLGRFFMKSNKKYKSVVLVFALLISSLMAYIGIVGTDKQDFKNKDNMALIVQGPIYWDMNFIWYACRHNETYEVSETTSTSYRETPILNWTKLSYLTIEREDEVSCTHTEGTKTDVSLSLGGKIQLIDLKAGFSHQWSSSDSTKTGTKLKITLSPGTEWVRLIQTETTNTSVGQEYNYDTVRKVNGVHITEPKALANLGMPTRRIIYSGTIYVITETTYGYYDEASSVNPYLGR